MLTVQRRPKIPTPSVVVQRFSLNSRGHFKGEAERTDDHLCAACLDSPFRAVKLIRGSPPSSAQAPPLGAPLKLERAAALSFTATTAATTETAGACGRELTLRVRS